MQFLNEQNLVNMSIIEQLNNQAEYLNSIVERLELIYASIQPQTINQPVEQNLSRKEPEMKSEVIEDHKSVRINVNESDPIEIVTREVNRFIVFGDRIRVITQTGEKTGVFIELDDQFLVWVIDEGKLTFTDIVGATIIKLT